MIVYLKSHRRRPVAFGGNFADRQGAVPDGWCDRCGREVFGEGLALCRRCSGKEKEYEKLSL